ncbi:uncharacterized protein C8Q71DRAFT_354791 [Rhodofomes roseus]|uniref:Uncharacterized protein n=1 Tax=Rhodofomes roseus TaxID=34475 RepID=A0ABQ8KUH2_9APHY|nr:uncharacterized protein C8Q71DRAFT_354791 [Rhodofomes roseus]KAH9841932.1 hypothetical protein C8Q71DRAFT_354791 [Rhodofomes roseus]
MELNVALLALISGGLGFSTVLVLAQSFCPSQALQELDQTLSDDGEGFGGWIHGWRWSELQTQLEKSEEYANDLRNKIYGLHSWWQELKAVRYGLLCQIR